MEGGVVPEVTAWAHRLDVSRDGTLLRTAVACLFPEVSDVEMDRAPTIFGEHALAVLTPTAVIDTALTRTLATVQGTIRFDLENELRPVVWVPIIHRGSSSIHNCPYDPRP